MEDKRLLCNGMCGSPSLAPLASAEAVVSVERVVRSERRRSMGEGAIVPPAPSLKGTKRVFLP